jgi:hypothetical protein
MHAWVNANWSLADRTTGAKIWTKDVNGDGRATVGEAIVGSDRQFKALERAAQANIDSALSQVGTLQLKSP